MTIHRISLPALAIGAALCVAAPGAQAQRWFAGLGGAVAAVNEGETEVSAARPGVSGLLGYRLGRGISTGLELSVYGLGDDEPLPSDWDAETSTLRHRPTILGTQTLLAFVQLGGEEVGGGFVRPMIGVGRHAFGFYEIGAGNQAVGAGTSHEAGLAAGVAAGYAVPLGGRASVRFEGVAVWSGGEDSSGDRHVYGVRIVPTLGL